jgi:hypothetical protein
VLLLLQALLLLQHAWRQNPLQHLVVLLIAMLLLRNAALFQIC